MVTYICSTNVFDTSLRTCDILINLGNFRLATIMRLIHCGQDAIYVEGTANDDKYF